MARLFVSFRLRHGTARCRLGWICEIRVQIAASRGVYPPKTNGANTAPLNSIPPPFSFSTPSFPCPSVPFPSVAQSISSSHSSPKSSQEVRAALYRPKLSQRSPVCKCILKHLSSMDLKTHLVPVAASFFQSFMQCK